MQLKTGYKALLGAIEDAFGTRIAAQQVEGDCRLQVAVN